MKTMKEEKYEVLKKYFGYDNYRNGQEFLIDAVLDGRDVLGIMPTGAGKSICYQIPAVMLYPLLDMALSVYNNGRTFDDADITAYERF